MDDTPNRQLNWYTAKEGFQVEFKFLEPCHFKYKRRMRFMKKKELLSYYCVQLKNARQEFYTPATLETKKSSSSREVAVLQLRVKALGQDLFVQMSVKTHQYIFTRANYG